MPRSHGWARPRRRTGDSAEPRHGLADYARVGGGPRAGVFSLPLLLSVAVVLILAWRVALMIGLPLSDNAEARYSDIARRTVEHGYWLMPHTSPGVPFFAKPPLSTWLTAASMQMFGIHEWAARLPSLVMVALALLIAWRWAHDLGVKQRWMVMLAISSSPLMFVTAGAVMTDAVQMTIVSAALWAAWQVLKPERQPADPSGAQRKPRGWLLAFWALIGVGALSKGLATWALVLLPIGVYALLSRQMVRTVRSLWDSWGALLAVAIFLPWYAAAEAAYPGFLRYFIVGEHLSRFLVSGWAGDRYGTAHDEPIGMIWAYWAVAIFPWIGVFATQLWQQVRKHNAPGKTSAAALELYLWCATLAPLVFFTFTRNLIWTYTLTAIVPFALLCGRWFDSISESYRRRVALVALVLCALAPLTTWLIVRAVTDKSDRGLVARYRSINQQAAKQAGSAPLLLIYFAKPSFSSYFYTRDRLVYEPDPNRAIATARAQANGVLVVPAVLVEGMGASAYAEVLAVNKEHALVRVQP